MAKKEHVPAILVLFLVMGGLGALGSVGVIAIRMWRSYERGETLPIRESSTSASVTDPTTPLDVKLASADGAFRREGAEQLYGYYVPKTDIRQGQYKLADIALGAQDDFATYTASGDMAGWAPVMAVFADTARPPAPSMEGTGNRFPVLPSRYSVVGDTITFSGHDEKVGNIEFSGKLDLVKIGHYIALNEGSSEPVMTGDLTINGKVYPKVDFTYDPGD